MKPGQLGLFVHGHVRQGRLVRPYWRYYSSGQNHPGEILGHQDQGHPVGVSARELTPRALEVLQTARVPVFVDSGAFSEVDRAGAIVRPMGEAEWARVLDVYDRLAGAGVDLTVVAPDRVGDQAYTLDLLRRHRLRLRQLMDRGVQVLVPLQRGTWSLQDFADRVDGVLGRTWTPAIPSNKAAAPLHEVVDLVRERQPFQVHLLGRGPRRASTAAVLEAIATASPQTRISLDSNWHLAQLGEGREGTRQARLVARSGMPTEDRKRVATARTLIARAVDEEHRHPGSRAPRFWIQSERETVDEEAMKAKGLVSATMNSIWGPMRVWTTPADLYRMQHGSRGLAGGLDSLHKATQVGLWGQPVPVRAHVRQGHLVHAHVRHVEVGQAYLERLQSKARKLMEKERHPDLQAALRPVVEATTVEEADARVEGLRTAVGHLAAPARDLGDQLAESARKHRAAWHTSRVGERRAQYGPLGAPGPGERGYTPAARPVETALDGRPVREVAATMLDLAWRYREDPIFADLYRRAFVGEDEEDEEDGVWSVEDLPELLMVPRAGPDGKAWTLDRRLSIVHDTMQLVWEVTGEEWGTDWWPTRPLPREPGEALPRWLAEVIIEDALTPELAATKGGRIVEVTPDQARRFIAQHHSALPKWQPLGLMYSIGFQVDGRLVAVATAGNPVGRPSDPLRVLEVTRIASDGSTLGASSALMARMIDLVERSRREGAQGPALLVTYSLTREAGTTYRALAGKGLRPVARIARQRAAGGARGSGRQALAQEPKIRWEAGPGAGPADWTLLDDVGTGQAATR